MQCLAELVLKTSFAQDVVGEKPWTDDLLLRSTQPLHGVHEDDSHVDLLHIPSLTVNQEYVKMIPGCLFYEERLLCFLLHLNNPHNRVIYVTSMPVSPSVVDYYLSLLTQVSVEDARKRLALICCYDVTLAPLCEKMLKRPRLMKRLKSLICPERTILSTYAHTEGEREIASQLGVEGNSSPACPFWGTKTGSRIVFHETGTPHSFGTHKSLESTDAIVQSVVSLLKEKPDLRNLMVKLDEGVSGLGNATWTLPDSVDPNVLKNSLENDIQPYSGESPGEFLAHVPKVGAIVEEHIIIKDLSSPSVQGIVCTDGTVRIVSSHEQVLHDDIYVGCTFPAREDYRVTLQKYTYAVGEFLANRGVRNERYGVDFVAWQQNGEWQLLAIEINLRNLGTTHPMMALQLVNTSGKLTPEGEFIDQDGRPRSYFALDAFQHPSLTSLTPDDLFDLINDTPILQYNKKTASGTIFYMMDALSSFGKVGIMCIQETASQAIDQFEKVKQVLLEECEQEPTSRTSD